MDTILKWNALLTDHVFYCYCSGNVSIAEKEWFRKVMVKYYKLLDILLLMFITRGYKTTKWGIFSAIEWCRRVRMNRILIIIIIMGCNCHTFSNLIKIINTNLFLQFLFDIAVIKLILLNLYYSQYTCDILYYILIFYVLDFVRHDF